MPVMLKTLQNGECARSNCTDEATGRSTTGSCGNCNNRDDVVALLEAKMVAKPLLSLALIDLTNELCKEHQERFICSPQQQKEQSRKRNMLC